MTILPQVQTALVEAAASPRKAAFRRARGPVLAFAVALVAVAVAISSLGPTRQTGGLPTVPQESIEQAAALAAIPDPTGEATQSTPDELAAFVRQLQTELPYPPGRTDDDLPKLIAGQAAVRLDGPGGMGQVSIKRDVRFQAEFRAACTWQKFWVDAASDADARRAATEVLQFVPRWPSSRSSSQVAGEIATAARDGNTALLRKQVTANCGAAPSRRGP